MGKQVEKMCDVVSLRDNYFDNVRGRLGGYGGLVQSGWDQPKDKQILEKCLSYLPPQTNKQLSTEGACLTSKGKQGSQTKANCIAHSVFTMVLDCC